MAKLRSGLKITDATVSEPDENGKCMFSANVEFDGTPPQWARHLSVAVEGGTFVGMQIDPRIEFGKD